MNTKKKRRGRPPKSSDAAKSESVLLRVSSKEKSGLQAAAELAGVPLSVWMRERLRKAARLELESAGQSVPFLDGFEAAAGTP
jgi:hypothetical protein